MAKTILVVEDTRAIREIIAHLLRSRGYDVVESADGRDAWEKATTISPDLIVLDVMLPGKTGFEIAAGLKADDRWKTIPLLMLSAVAGGTRESDEQLRQRSAADGFLSKPFRAVDLLAQVGRLLTEDRAERGDRA